MSKDELLARLIELQSIQDTEKSHADADSSLIDFINDPEIEAAYGVLIKWYA